MKKILQPILLIIVALGIGAFVWGKISPDSAGTTAAPASTPATAAATAEANATQPTEQPSVVVTYFTTDVRCVSCVKIESLTRETLERDFADAMESGRLRFQTINIDRPENKHYISQYALAFKTVVVTGQPEGSAADWEKLDDVWRLLNAPADFAAYIRGAVLPRLESAS